MDSTRAPVSSGQERLRGHSSIASRRPAKLAALQALLFCLAVTTVIVVSPAQSPPTNPLADAREGRLPASAGATNGTQDQRSSLTIGSALGPGANKGLKAGKRKPEVWSAADFAFTTGTSEGGRPGIAVSKYIKTTKTAKLARLGCAEGKRLRRSTDPDGHIVVLAFGRPTQKGKGKGNQWGASLFRRGFHSTSGIQRAAQAYAQGAWRCMHGEKASTHLTVAIGTSNFGGGVSFRHGRAWAEMVNHANDWAAEKSYATRVRFAGANDIELNWAGPRRTRAWVRGYDSVGRWPYFDYGDAAACPPRGNCHGAWTIEDVWFVAWGARTARPLPEIYNPSGIMAEQWYRLSLYSFKEHGSRMSIAGVMSQHRACRQSRDPCWGMNNSPAKAWRQLHRWLNRDRRTAQPLHWSTDIAWSD
jgi:hypothetical protein